MTSQPKFTPQQAAAILTRGVSIALSAGAGCGKTFVLTQRFLAGLEPDPAGESSVDLQQLVAITFTARAAREMRDRIRAACDERLRNCPSAEVGHWLGILRGLDSARISTIHSFCTSLLQSQAVEAGLDPRFAVLEAAQADTLLRHVARDTLHRLIQENNDDAVQIVIQFGLERAEELLRKLTNQRFQIDFVNFVNIRPKELAEAWLYRWKMDFVPKLVAKFRESPLIVRVLELITDSPSKNATMIERIAHLGSILPVETPWPDPKQVLEEIQDHARVQGGGGKKDWVSESRQEEIKLAFEQLRKNVKGLQDNLEISEADVTKSAELACRAVRLTQKTADMYAAAKRAQGVLDFDDLLLHARNLLRDNDDVRHRIAAGIRLLMVDEFQDTDPVQADVVRSLCGAAITRGKLFMVGDRKQSIYRFRRADPTVFATMSDELPPSGRLPLNVNFRSQPAVLNFVNHLFSSAMEAYEPLVPFQQDQQSPTPAIEFLFAGFEAEGADSTAPAGASTNSFDESASDDDVRPNAAELRRREADWIARRIAAVLADPTPRIRSKQKDENGQPVLRRAEPGDIVILFRALSNVQDYEAALRRFGLEYYLVGGKAFFAQQEIFDLLNLCRYLDDCDDLVGLVGVLRSPFFNLSDDTIHALAFHTDVRSAEVSEEIGATNAWPTSETNSPMTPVSRVTRSLHETLYFDPPSYLSESQQNRIRFAADVLNDLRQRKDRIPLSELLTWAVERSGYDAAILAEFLGERKLANLRKLIEMARQYDQSDVFTLKDFVTRLQTSVMEETDEEFATTQPESGDVIRLMSIHQSKGLEFPIVIVADIDRKGPPRGSDAVLHPELGPLIKPPEKFGHRAENLALRMHKLTEEEADAEETIRLFYVACTRAADYLILSTGMDPDKPAQSPWRQLVEQRFDIRTGLLKTDPWFGSSEAGLASRDNIPDVLIHHIPCQTEQSTSHQEKRVAPGEIVGSVLAAHPREFPPLVRTFSRDLDDLNMISVSRLEAIDAELNGFKHHPSESHRSDGDARDVDVEVDFDQATLLGTIVHQVLERINFQDVSAWPELLIDLATHSRETLSEKIIQQAQTVLSRFMDSPLVYELARARCVYREMEFSLPWPAVPNPAAVASQRHNGSRPLVTGVIDLLFETESGWHILDYKTGDFPLKSSDVLLLAPYELQLGLYAHAFEQWFGVPPVELSLVAFRPHVRRLTMPWSPKKWDQIQTRINRAIHSIVTAGN